MPGAPFYFSFLDNDSDVLVDKLHSDFQRLLLKWGLHAEVGSWLLKAFNYQIKPSNGVNARDIQSANPHEGMQGSTARSGLNPASTTADLSPPLQFHDDAAGDFLKSFFSSLVVQDSLRQAGCRALNLSLEKEPTKLEVLEVDYASLRTSWTNLEPLIDPLVRIKAVRRLLDTEKLSGVNQAHLEATRLPITKRIETMLPREVLISDEVRALFLQANTCNAQLVGSKSDKHFTTNNVADFGEDAEEGEDDPYYSLMMGSCGDGKLPMSTLRAAYAAEDKQEFIYHAAWRLVAGGGAMNQFEDDFAVYRDAVRMLFRRLITSIRVQESDGLTIASGKEKSQNPEGINGMQGANVKYTPEILSQVFQVHRVEPLQLFPLSDGRIPSNLNYCYVIVNPLQQTAILWYHCC